RRARNAGLVGVCRGLRFAAASRWAARHGPVDELERRTSQPRAVDIEHLAEPRLVRRDVQGAVARDAGAQNGRRLELDEFAAGPPATPRARALRELREGSSGQGLVAGPEA